MNTWATQTKDEGTVQISTLLSNILFANFNSFVILMLIYCIDKFLPFISFHQFSLHSYGGKERISVYKANSEQKKMYFLRVFRHSQRSSCVASRHWMVAQWRDAISQKYEHITYDFVCISFSTKDIEKCFKFSDGIFMWDKELVLWATFQTSQTNCNMTLCKVDISLIRTKIKFDRKSLVYTSSRK